MLLDPRAFCLGGQENRLSGGGLGGGGGLEGGAGLGDQENRLSGGGLGGTDRIAPAEKKGVGLGSGERGRDERIHRESREQNQLVKKRHGL